jgi:hypothetical protein
MFTGERIYVFLYLDIKFRLFQSNYISMTDSYRDFCLSDTLSNILQEWVLKYIIIIIIIIIINATFYEQWGVEVKKSECLV